MFKDVSVFFYDGIVFELSDPEFEILYVNI